VLWVEAPGDTVVRLILWLLPRRAARRIVVRKALARLGDELEKHAGRARSDLARRLDAARIRFEKAMAAEMDRTATSVAEAARRAMAMRQEAEAEQDRRHAEDGAAREAIRDVRAVLSRQS
jgi:hypothetical protein